MKLSLRRYVITNRAKLPLLIAAALVLVFIWSQSFMPTEDSASESGWITDHIINPILSVVGLSVTNNFVRKCAHVTEYTVVSILISLIWDCHPVRSFYSGFTVSFMDETIQVISGRGPMITDMWIDLIGVVLGYAAAVLIRLYHKKKPVKNKWITKTP